MQVSPTPTDNNITDCDLLVFAAFLALSQQCRHRKAGSGLHALPSSLQPVVILLTLLFEVLEQGTAAQSVGINKALHMRKRKWCDVTWVGAVNALLKPFPVQPLLWNRGASPRAVPETRLVGRSIRHRGRVKGEAETLMGSLKEVL